MWQRPVSVALVHFLSLAQVKDEKPNPLFDTKFYLEKNPEVAATGESVVPLLGKRSGGRQG